MAKNVNCLGVIPARFPSTRFPGKPLKDICGKTVIQRAWEQCKQAKNLSKVVVSTDDERVQEAAIRFGAEVVMTGSHHENGSERVCETYEILNAAGETYDFVANVQGDMPFIQPEAIDQVIQALADADPSFGMGTIARPIIELEEFLKTSAVKVVVGDQKQALYFSRAPIPYARDGFEENGITEELPYGYKHLGLYVFRPEVLKQVTSLTMSPIEAVEKLEQLRALANGFKIKVAVMPISLLEPSIEIDTPEDLEKAIAYVNGL